MTKSLLKWPGGKIKLLPVILPELTGNRLLEPFMGSLVVSLNASQDTILANDYNPDLVNLFEDIKKDKPKFLKNLRLLYKDESESGYYDVREKFNKGRASCMKSARFVYLNKHGFNGLCRYNRNKEFNVSYNKNSNAYFPEPEIEEISKILNDKNFSFFNFDFLIFMDKAQKGDVVYCDPPYAPLNATSFTNYSGESFTYEQQAMLAIKAEELQKRGVKVVISNHDTELTRKLYKNATRILKLDVLRTISTDSSTRGTAPELVAIYEV